MSLSLAEMVQLEIAQIHQVLDDRSEVIENAISTGPSEIERDAIAVTLHSFYNGIERILVLISRDAGEFQEIEESVGGWHQALLLSFGSARRTTGLRIPDDLMNRLLDYMRFRHLFRHAYSFDLRWTRMKPLVIELDRTLKDFESALRQFINL